MNFDYYSLIYLLMYIVIFGPSLISSICFLVSLILFLRTPKDDDRRKYRKARMVISGIVAAVFIGILAVLIILFMIAIQHM